MTSERGATYEIRGERLYANGERQTVSRLTVIVAVARYRREGGRLPEPKGEVLTIEIPAELARVILSLERKLALAKLAVEIADKVSPASAA